MKSLIVTLGCLLAVAAQARIGETPQQCVERYGQALQTDVQDQSCIFAKNGLHIMTNFYQGVCESIHFLKQKEEGEFQRKNFTEVEVQALLEANGKGRSWKPEKGGIGVQGYVCDDGQTVAVWDKLNRYFRIVTIAQTQRDKAAKAAKEKKNLEGF